MLKTVYDPKQQQHDTTGLVVQGQAFLEVPRRAEILQTALAQSGWCSQIEPKDYGTGPLAEVHSPGYLEFLEQIATLAAPYRHIQGGGPALGDTFAPGVARHFSPHPWAKIGRHTFDVSVPFLPGTWAAAYASAQCALSAAELVLDGDRTAYALCRPPGHHALSAQAGGYCYLNNAAIAARYLQRHHGGMRVAILDIDYHHGNGTQEIFYADPGVLYVSLHADPDEEYPFYWGGADERGIGAGQGATLNLPLPAGSGDAQYLDVLDDALDAVREYAPIFLVVSAGFDGGLGDPSALTKGFTLTQDGFAAIGQRIRALDRPTVLVQEGGYRLDTLADNALSFLRAFA